MLNKIKRMNYYLIIGSIMSFSLLFIAIFGSFIAPYDITKPELIRIDPDTGKQTSPPFSPSLSHIFGTDTNGSDVLSKLLHGAKYTLIVVLVISISRLIIALPVGFIIGWWPKYLKGPFSSFTKSWSSLPLFLFIVAIISPMLAFDLNKYLLITLLWLILTLAGIPPMIETIRGYIENIKNYEFMEGVRVLGASPFHIFYKHIFPHLKPYLIIILAMEMSQILWLLGQLGVFHIFVGGTITSKDQLQGVTYYYSVSNEWAGLLGYGRRMFRSVPWLFFAPALAFTYGVFSFQLLAEGLRRRINKDVMKYDF